MGYQDVDAARALAEWMYTERGVDTIFTAAGGSGRGVIEAATELSDDLDRQLWAIGVDTDNTFELQDREREHLLTSMVKKLDHGVEHIVEQFDDGHARGAVVRPVGSGRGGRRLHHLRRPPLPGHPRGAA